MLSGPHSYTYHPSEVSHTVAEKGDTDKWTTALSALVHSDRAGVELKPRDLLRLDNVILEVELKKASVGEDEIKNNHGFRSSLVQIANRAEGELPENRRWHFKERTTKLCLYFWGSATESVDSWHQYFYLPSQEDEEDW